MGRIALIAGLLAALLAISFAFVAADDGGDVCGPDQSLDPTLVSVNCRFEGKGNDIEPYGLIRPYWNPFVISGSPRFDTLDTHNAYGWLPDHQGDQKIYTVGKPWSAGIWQRVPNVITGQGYRADAGWVISQNSLAVGRIGIDPTGGSDPLSPNITWSKPLLVCNALRCRDSVQAYAASNVLSVWVQVTITVTEGPDNAWISAVGVKTDKSMPAPPVTATATPRPTASFTRIPPSRTPSRTATPPPTGTPISTPVPSATPSPTATTTPTIASSDIPTTTPAPSPTFAPILVSAHESGSASPAGSDSIVIGPIVGGLVLMMLGALAGLRLFLARRVQKK